MIPSLEHFATHEHSEYPHLWKGVTLALAPCLGVQGSQLQDFSGRGNVGTLVNMDPPTDWLINGGQYALDFDGSNDLVAMTADATGVLKDFSFFGWQYFRASNCALWTRAVNGFSLIYLATATSFYVRGESLTQLPTFAVPDMLNRWSFVSVTRQGSSLRLFVDGVESSTGVRTTSFDFVFDRIGHSSGNQFMPNLLCDDQCFLNRAASASEISERYQIGRGGMYTPRIRHPMVFDFGSALRRRLLLTGQT